MTVREAVLHASTRIALRDAETLLLHVLRAEQRNRAWLLAHPEAPLAPAGEAELAQLVARRAGHEPLQYLTGHQEFFGLDFAVSPAVLIPRPETELLVEATLAWIQEHAADPGCPGRLLDVGTGSGAIALALAAHLPLTWEITAVDLSPAALAVAQENAASLGLAKRVRFHESDLLQGVGLRAQTGQSFDVIASNPPYVPEADAPGLQPEVRDFEPHAALFAAESGLAVYRRLIPQAREALRPGGLLVMEFGFGQREALAELLGGWKAVRFEKDLAGIPRVALAERP